LITNAVKRDARTFTQLLRITELPRKTLNIRLKELCNNGILTNKEGAYKFNGSSGHEKSVSSSISRLSGVIYDKKMKGLVLLGLLVIGLPSVSYVMAMLFPAPTQPAFQEPQVLGSLTVALDVFDVNDLYAWQALVSFNSDELKVLQVNAGEFLKDDYPFLPLATDIGDGILFIGNTLVGDVPGVGGSGNLAVIIFGYFTKEYKDPQIVEATGAFETKLLDSSRRDISLTGSTLKLTSASNN